MAKVATVYPRIVYDFEECADTLDLRRVLGEISLRRYSLICVTLAEAGGYLVFFQRPAYG